MRPGSTFPTNTDQSAPSTTPLPCQSGWHGPIPYLFGGLAAMLGLIALALLILACSYWKLNSLLSNSSNSDETPPTAAGDSKPVGSTSPVILHQLFAVFMPGEDKPTFIATPSCSCSVSFECEKGEEKIVNVIPGESRRQGEGEEELGRTQSQGIHEQPWRKLIGL
ncbi:hypothetical protein LUZ60_008858 [Juncus effusus]|nr:hypothetical protein LUZ60_008858 [Juncus effusus]